MRFLFILAALSLAAEAAVCQGEDPCKACKDCSRCDYCTSKKGSCGTLRDQNEAEAKKRRAKERPPKK